MLNQNKNRIFAAQNNNRIMPLEIETIPKELPSTDQMTSLLDKLMDIGVSAGKNIIVAIIIIVVGRLIIKFINRLIRRMLEKTKIDAAVQSFIRSLANMVLMTLLVISAIGALGIETTSFAALLASGAVAVGMALSGNLQNFSGGIIILIFKPYRVGDFIEVDGKTGKVEEIQIFHTILRQIDNQIIYIPNSTMSTATIINKTREGTRRIEWTIGVAYGTDLKEVETAVNDVLDKNEYILKEPAWSVMVNEMADSSVSLSIYAWVKSEDVIIAKSVIYAEIYRQFQQKGIEIPFPQRTVHIVKE